MSVESWRQQVSTSDGCKKLFQSDNFKTDITKCLIELHESSLKLIQNANKNKSLDMNAVNMNFQKIILLYRTIRNLSSINLQSKWIIIESKIIPNMVQFLNNVFIKLCEILPLSNSSNEDNEYFVLLCDIIRAAFQIFSNLSFHEFDNDENNVHLMLWSHFSSSQSSSNWISVWIEQLLAAMCKDHNNNIIIETNMSRILEPISAFLHEFMVNHAQILDGNESKMFYNIQLIDVHCFGNNKNYLYQKTENENKINDVDEKTDDEDDENEDDFDDFDKWKHHEWIRKLIPYFINSDGLTFYIDNLHQESIKLYYFQVSIELLFEMTESILIDIKTPSINDDVQLMQKHKIYLIQHPLKNTFQKLLNVVHYSLKHIFPPIFEKMMDKSPDSMLINLCQNILETISNVALISTSIDNKNDMRKYQNDLMNCCGSIIIESTKTLQNQSDKMAKYCKQNNISDNTFNKIYEGTISKILSFRRQFVSIISTLCCDNKLNQDYIRNNGVIELLLNMTKIDRFTLFLQQWSIFAIKNITDNNLENQQYIQSIKAQKVIENEEMRKLGIKITYDEITGKIVAKKDT